MDSPAPARLRTDFAARKRQEFFAAADGSTPPQRKFLQAKPPRARPANSGNGPPDAPVAATQSPAAPRPPRPARACAAAPSPRSPTPAKPAIAGSRAAFLAGLAVTLRRRAPRFI